MTQEPRDLNVTVRLSVSTKAALQERAELNRRSMSSEIGVIVESALVPTETTKKQ